MLCGCWRARIPKFQARSRSNSRDVTSGPQPARSARMTLQPTASASSAERPFANTTSNSRNTASGRAIGWPLPVPTTSSSMPVRVHASRITAAYPSVLAPLLNTSPRLGRPGSGPRGVNLDRSDEIPQHLDSIRRDALLDDQPVGTRDRPPHWYLAIDGCLSGRSSQGTHPWHTCTMGTPGKCSAAISVSTW